MTSSPVIKETRRWLAYAKQDAAVAHELLQSGKSYPNATCYHAQQAAEKALKGGLIFAQIDFPFVHDLTVLKNLLPSDWKTSQNSPNLSILSSWATGARYPGIATEPTDEDAEIALKQAEQVISTILEDLAASGFKL